MLLVVVVLLLLLLPFAFATEHKNYYFIIMLMCFDCVTVISVDVCCRYKHNNDGKIEEAKKYT